MGRGWSGAWWRVSVTVLFFLGWVLTAAGTVVAQSSVPTPSASRIGVGGLSIVRLRDGSEAAADSVIVRFRDTVQPSEQNDVHRVVAGGLAVNPPRAIQQSAVPNRVVVETAGGSVDDAVAAYRADSRVLYAQPNYLRYTSETPNDPSFASQYGLAKIGAPTAWNTTHGSPAVKIAILDTGISESHPDLVGKVVQRQDFTGSASGANNDRIGHGTHVAGIASAATNNGTGVAGVGYLTSLMNAKVCAGDVSDQCFDADVVNAIYWAANSGARVINMSLGSGGSCVNTPDYQNAINYASGLNVVVVAAAGNTSNTSLQVPASCNNVVSVASTDSNDVKSSFSTYGTWVKIAAPGSSIYSTIPIGFSCPIMPPLPNGYCTKSGTSMATPHVAGVAALLWATSYGTSAESVISRMYATADRIAGTGSFWQSGRVNVGAAVPILPPSLAGLSPGSVAAGGTPFTLTVNGAGFQNGATVRWNGANRATMYASSTQLVATIPAADTAQMGTAAITVINPDGQVSGALSFTITIAPPRPAAVQPDTGVATGGTGVTILGSGFRGGATVTIGGNLCVSVIVISDGAITCTTTAGNAGSADLVIRNTDGTSGSQTGAFMYMSRVPVLPVGTPPNPAPPARAAPPALAPNAVPNPAPPRR